MKISFLFMIIVFFMSPLAQPIKVKIDQSLQTTERERERECCVCALARVGVRSFIHQRFMHVNIITGASLIEQFGSNSPP